MILVDQTAVPLAALMVLGGRLGDLLGLRRVFLVGALFFTVATGAAGAAQDMPMLIAARAVQGAGAALMMPMAVAITSAVYPPERRGWALGILAGASAFFAALGPVLGGLLTSIDWRLVFWINVPLAVVTVLLTLSATPDFRPDEREPAEDRLSRDGHLWARHRGARARLEPGAGRRSPRWCRWWALPSSLWRS
jgi:MFS family permease